MSTNENENENKSVDWGSVSGTQALAMLADLPADQRVALVMRYIDDLPVQEVADQIGRSLAATESLLARGRRQLGRRINAGGTDG